MHILKSTAVAASVLLVTGLTAFAQQTATVTYAYNGLPLLIPVDSADVISIATITVPRALKMTKVTAQLQIQYPNTGDLNVYLYSPQGTRTKLLEHNCSIANVDTTFDDAAPSTWASFCPTEAGRGPFKANEPLSNFNSDDTSFGVWSLAIENDSSDSRAGWLNGFTLNITGTTQVTPTINAMLIGNTASLSNTGTVAPGEMVSIVGLAIGPATPVSAPSGALPTTLGGTMVNFNGTAAPIAYVSQYRADVQVPFNVTPGGTMSVQVVANGQSSNTATVSVLNVAPGVYTASTTIGGAGPTKAVNQTGTLNSVLNPATKGSVIAVYASGLGAVNPAVAAGAVPPTSPLSRVSGDVGAFIGGVAAMVQFAGLAPGSPGVYQVNIMVPATAPSGVQPLQIYSSGVPTQAGATIVIQ